MDRVTSLMLLLVSSLLVLLPSHAVTRLTAIQSPPMVLPLYLSSAHPNNKPTFQFSRRHLHRVDENRTSNARMSLYDDLLTNGYYTTKLWIGTPPQEFALIVDSGSTVTYVPCESCEQCGNHQDPRFQPDQSSTYQPVKCNIDCTCDADNTQCTYERQYAEMSSSSGVLGEDIVSFGSQSALVPQRAVFGCENSETGDLFSQHADGIMGLGRGPLSIMDQLVEKGVIGDSFSLCYGGMDIGGGAMVLGELPLPSEMVFAKSDPVRSPYYNIELKEIHVSGKPLKLKPKVFDSKHGTVLDSGTTYAYLPKEAFVAFKDAVISNLHLKQIPGPDPNFKDICFSTAGSDVSELSEIFPEVAMVFGNGQNLALSPENYLFRHSKVHDAYCLGVFQNGRDPTTLLGGIVVRNTLVTYDRSKERIGFWKTNCSELWKVLQSHVAPSSSPTPSTLNEDTIGLPPSLPPTGSQNPTLTDQIQVALISLEISLSVKYKDLKPHMAELAESIAHELRINASQVHLMNSTSILNGTLIKCSILPSGSDFISNTTAMGMISRFKEHRVRLPETYGNYQLVQWKVEPSSRGSWWRRHKLGVIASLASMMLICSALAVWFFWRYKTRELGSYIHVNSAHPEQELQLQPL